MRLLCGLVTVVTVVAALCADAATAAKPPGKARPEQPETVKHADCPGGRPVAVAVLTSRDNREAADALEGALAAWHCVNVVMIPARAPGTGTNTDADDLERAANEDVDWVVIVRGTAALMNARLVDPALKEVLVLSHGPADEVTMELLAPVSREMTLAKRGGGRLVLSVVGVSYAEVGELENAIKAMGTFTDVGVGVFKEPGARFVLRTNAPSDEVVSALSALRLPVKSTDVTGVRLRRIELTFTRQGANTP